MIESALSARPTYGEFEPITLNLFPFPEVVGKVIARALAYVPMKLPENFSAVQSIPPIPAFDGYAYLKRLPEWYGRILGKLPYWQLVCCFLSTSIGVPYNRLPFAFLSYRGKKRLCWVYRRAAKLWNMWFKGICEMKNGVKRHYICSLDSFLVSVGGVKK